VIITLTVRWTRRTKPRAAAATKTAHQEWVRTRDIILKVVRRFPEVIGAVREALAVADRPLPEELHAPG
jgi:hypothetical protein